MIRDHAPVAALLLHGLCSTAEELLPVERALAAAGIAVRRARIPGYTYEPAAARQTATPWQGWLQEVASQVRELRSTHARVVLVGLSAGAALALGAAMQGEVVIDGLVLMSTTLQYDGWAVPRRHVFMPLALYTPLGRFWQYRERPPYGVKNERVRRWIERELAARAHSAAGAAVIGVAHLREHDRLRRALRRGLAGFECPPVLALHAREDEVAGLGNLALLAARLRTPSFRAVVLGNSHHMITIDNDRQQVAQETVSFALALGTPASFAAEHRHV